MNLDSRTAESSQELCRRWIFPDGEPQESELPLNRSSGVVTHTRDAAFSAIENGQRLQYVVELGCCEIDIHVLASADVSGVLEISDAVFVENDARDRQAGGGTSRSWCDWSLAKGKCWKRKEQHGYLQRVHRSSVNESSRATQRGVRQKTSSASQDRSAIDDAALRSI